MKCFAVLRRLLLFSQLNACILSNSNKNNNKIENLERVIHAHSKSARTPSNFNAYEFKNQQKKNYREKGEWVVPEDSVETDYAVK